MTNLNQALAAFTVAKRFNTRANWQAAALALHAVLAAPAAVVPLKPKRAKATAADPKHTGKRPIAHVMRCTLADGFTMRLSCGQFRGQTRADALARMERLTLTSWRNAQTTAAMGALAAINNSLAFKAAMDSLVPPAVTVLAIARDGITGAEIEAPVAIAA